MSTSKEIKSAIKEVEKKIKRLQSGLAYIGMVDKLCFIYKKIKNPSAGNIVCVLDGAVRFTEDPNGNYIRDNKKYCLIREYKSVIPKDAPRYKRHREHNVMYLYTGKSWVKC